jgi:hypothetical protein
MGRVNDGLGGFLLVISPLISSMRRHLLTKSTALALATFFILTRSCFRVAELSRGFGGKLANEEIPFMILEGSIVSLATLLMTGFHPGQAFGEKWVDAGWNWKKEQAGDSETQRDSTPVHEVEVEGVLKT